MPSSFRVASTKRCKDAGSARSRSYGRDRGRRSAQRARGPEAGMYCWTRHYTALLRIQPGFLSNPAVAGAGNQRDAVLVPAAVDEVADLRAHLDLLGPGPGPLLRPLGGRVDPELAADELALRRVVEVVERPFRKHDVPGRVDVGPRVEHHLLVVVD